MVDYVFTVCGAGRAGAAIAADIALMGHKVNLYELEQFKQQINPIIEHGGIELSGRSQSGRNGFAKLNKITTNPEEAVEDADLIIISSPAFSHNIFFEYVLPYLKPGQCVLVTTGYWASLRFTDKLKKSGKFGKIVVAESNIMPYLSDKDGYHSHILNLKREIVFSPFPGTTEGRLASLLKLVYPQMRRVPNILYTNLECGNPSVHATFLLPVAGLAFDRYRGCKLYGEATSCGARLVEAFDKERVKVANALDCKVTETELEAVKKQYGYEGKDAAEAYRKSVHADRFIPAERLKAILMEDLGYFYVPLSRLGSSLGVPTPVTSGIVEVWGAIQEVNYWEKGLTLKDLGLEGLNANQIIKYVNFGPDS
ncbi:MAG: NAD/NADP octopine/nopaline dehydrogenase family protein [Nitrososphaeria archaeon]